MKSEPELEISQEMQWLIEEDEQYWNYRDITPNQEGKILHWNSWGPRKMVLFDWLPWGVPGSYREVEVLVAQIWNHQDQFIQRLSEPRVQVLERNEIEWSPMVKLPHPSCYKNERRFVRGLGPLQTSNMSSSYRMLGDLYQPSNYWGIVPTGPQYCDHNQWPPSPPPRQCSNTPVYSQRESAPQGHEYYGEGCQGKSLVAQVPGQTEPPNTIAFEFTQQSPSPDVREVFEEDEAYENDLPILLKVPQLEGPIVFMKEALKSWGKVHEDNTEQSIQF